MKRNQTRLSLLLISLFLIFVLIFFKNLLNDLNANKNNLLFSKIKPEQITEILLTKVNTVSIYKKNNRWFLKKNNVQYIADSDKINGIISNFLKLKKENIVSNNKAKHQQLGIAKERIEFRRNGGSTDLYIGNTIGLTGNYVRIDNEDEVFTAEGFGEIFSTDDYRDLMLHFIGSQDQITLISLDSGENKFSLTKNKDGWTISQKKAKNDRVDFFLNDLKTLKAADIHEQKDLPSEKSLEISVMENKKAKTLTFYQENENSYLAKSSISNYIFQIPAAYVASLKKQEKDFIE